MDRQRERPLQAPRHKSRESKAEPTAVRATAPKRTAQRRAPASTHEQWIEDSLDAGEVVLTTVAGTDPSSVTSRKVASVLGGLLGVAIMRLVERRRASSGDAAVRSRTLCLTTQRLLVFDGAALTEAISVQSLKSAAISKAFSDTFRRVLTLRSTRDELAVEGEREAIEQFASAVIDQSGVGRESLVPVRSFWLGRALLVGVLYTFGVGAMLLAIPQFSDAGAGSGLTFLVIGAVLTALGELSRRRLFRRSVALAT